ncbi:hypothetical protein C5167_007851 [Papaver somniferum]|nr:hypothetical protein C5167_007851 [Papaver somniferum]
MLHKSLHFSLNPSRTLTISPSQEQTFFGCSFRSAFIPRIFQYNFTQLQTLNSNLSYAFRYLRNKRHLEGCLMDLIMEEDLLHLTSRYLSYAETHLLKQRKRVSHSSSQFLSIETGFCL